MLLSCIIPKLWWFVYDARVMPKLYYTRAMMTMRIKVRWDVLLVVTETDCVAIGGSTVGALSHPREVAGGRRSVLLSMEFIIARCTASLMSLAPCAASHQQLPVVIQ